jgi:hypothetical protein
MVVKLLIAALVVLPVLVLVISALRGRTKVESCCSVPADRDKRLQDVGDRPVSASASPPAP